MVPMRSPDEDATTGDDGSVTSSLGDGFSASTGDLADGFGEGDLADDDVEAGDDEFDFPGDDGDGLSDNEASNLLEEILEDVFGDDGPQVLDDVDADFLADVSTESDADFDVS